MIKDAPPTDISDVGSGTKISGHNRQSLRPELVRVDTKILPPRRAPGINVRPQVYAQRVPVLDVEISKPLQVALSVALEHFVATGPTGRLTLNPRRSALAVTVDL